MQPLEQLMYSSMTEQLMIPFDAKCPKHPLLGYLQNTHLHTYTHVLTKQVNPNLTLSILNEYSNHSKHVAYQKLPLNWVMPCHPGKTNAPPECDSTRNISFCINFCQTLQLTKTNSYLMLSQSLHNCKYFPFC